MNFMLQCFVFAFVSYPAEGKTYSMPYPSEGDCKDTVTEYFVSDVGRCSSKCPPGTRQAKPCTPENDAVCEPCTSGTYTKTWNYHHNCFSCTKCTAEKGLKYVKACSPTSNAVCECMPGFYCTGSMNPSCSRCRKYKTCPPGQGAKSLATQDIRCDSCPSGTFSNETSYKPCLPHTRCEGSRLLKPGTSMSDAVCEPTFTSQIITTISSTITPIITTTTNTKTSVPATASPPDTPNTPPTGSFSTRFPEKYSGYWIGFSVAVVVLLLVLLTLVAFVICRRKGLMKPDLKAAAAAGHGQETSIFFAPTEQQLLLDGKTDPPTSSSSSSSSSSSDGQSTGTSQDCLLTEQSSVSSPYLNFSVVTTTTINCQALPCPVTALGTAVPRSPETPVPSQPGPEPPLSQEEERCTTCQQEDGKEALQSVQESGTSEQ